MIGSLTGWLPTRSWPLFALATVAAVLDAVDGAVARRTDTVTERGAHWDQSVDAALLVVLSIAVAPFAPWGLAIGAARYLYLLGGYLRPAWRAPLPPSTLRRAIGGLQAAALITALAPAVPITAAQIIIGLALTLLMISFGRDIWWQERTSQPA